MRKATLLRVQISSTKAVAAGHLALLWVCMFVLMALGAASCKNKQAKLDSRPLPLGIKQTMADSLAAARAIDSADYGALFKNKTNAWLYKMLMNKQNKWANFTLIDYWRKDSMKEYAYTPANGFFTEYAMFLEWSPDSSYILDYGSYGVEMKKDKNGKYYVESGDVDQEIALINNKAKTAARLLFFGPSTNAWGAHWIDTTQVALLGRYNAAIGEHPDTMLWIIDVKNKFFRKYKYHIGEMEGGR